jgi:hypothetical protein
MQNMQGNICLFWPCKICTASGCCRRPVIVLSLRPPAFGQLLCPSYMGRNSHPHTLRYVPYSLIHFAHSGRLVTPLRAFVGHFLAHVFSPPAASFLSATRRCPAADLFDFASAALRHYTKVDPAGSCAAASYRRPFSAQHGRAHGGVAALATSVRRTSSLL